MALSLKQRISSIMNRLLGLQKERDSIEKRVQKLVEELTADMDKEQIDSLKQHINSL